MRIISKSTAADTLLFCFLTINFHNFAHSHNHHREVESNLPDSRKNKQHNTSKQCDECFNKDKKSYDLNFSDISYFVSYYIYICEFENYIGHFLPFNLHCRPPPRATT